MNMADLIDESVKLEETAGKIQKGHEVGLPEDEIAGLVERYDNWYAECLAILPDAYSGRFVKEYDGSTWSAGIKKFLDEPTERNPLYTPESASLLSYWLYPYTSTFRGRIRAQRQILREAQARQTAASDRQEQVTQGLKRNVVEGYVFIAMPMNPEDAALDDVLDAIKQVAVEHGLTAERVDDAATNERITDRILEALTKAEYVVADLTHGKPNVYYEAGYAHALGKIPIFIAREGTKLEFDIKDYPILQFRNMKGLRAALGQRLAGLIQAKAAQKED